MKKNRLKYFTVLVLALVAVLCIALFSFGCNGMHPGAKWDCPGAKWVGAWGKMGYALGQNAICPGAKWVGA